MAINTAQKDGDWGTPLNFGPGACDDSDSESTTIAADRGGGRSDDDCEDSDLTEVSEDLHIYSNTALCQGLVDTSVAGLEALGWSGSD